jgi:hypothetical protein
MATPKEAPKQSRGDERLSIPLEAEEALRLLLQVDPDSEPVEDEAKPEKKSKPKDAQDIYGLRA